MGSPQEPSKVKLFLAVLSKDGRFPARAQKLLGDVAGEADFSYGPVPFSPFSTYYESEMGEDLLKSYLTFSSLIPRDRLPQIKLLTNRIEEELSAEVGRTVNLDPGYLARDKLVLATTKDFFHRLYLGQGIYGEVTLHYRRGRYRYFSWTYPDYRDPAFCSFLENPRAVLVHESGADSEAERPFF